LKQTETPVEITLLEQADYWGGKLITNRVAHDGGQFVIEGGPDTFVVTKPWGVQLCKELGLTDRLRGTNPETKKTYILKNDKLHELPGGLTMMIPTEFGPMIRTGLLSWPAKARMGMDFFLPAAANGDETMGEFVTRRLGRSAYESLIEPLMSGIYAGDGDRLSLQSTLPYLRDLELKHGGLVKGALAVRKERARKAKSNGNEAKPTPGSRSIFLTPLTGLAEIVESLVQELETRDVTLKLSSGVETIERSIDDSWRLALTTGENLEADAIILATPAFVSGALIKNIAPNLTAELTAIEYVSTATVTLAFRESDLPRPLDGYGYVIPRREGRKALACTWTSTKFPHRAPEGYALVRVFVGRAGQEKQITWDDDGLLEIAREELELTLGITAEPMLTNIFQWEKAMPQYNLGHPARLERINTMLEKFPGLALAGNGYEGIGIPDCIHSGELAVGKILQQEKHRTAQR
jgi:oxygen-dependent protoporphyrinogen oxidase